MNSYKRTGAVATASGASWAPRTPTYGGNDRTHYIRLPDNQRVEMRGGDASANPYLAVAGALGAGLDGIAKGGHPGPIGSGPDGELPSTLLEAIDLMLADSVVCGVLDAAGPGVADYFAELKRAEFREYHAAVSAWELARYLTAF